MLSARALHYVFRVADRPQTIKFYRDILGMTVLRHEEFSDACAAACNGKFNNRWSKTMIGYGPEDSHFVVELTYNYGISNYACTDDFLGFTIESSEAIKRAKQENYPITEKNGAYHLKDPVGYPFILLDKPQPKDKDPVKKLSLGSSNLKKSLDYWNGILSMKILSQSDEKAELSYATDQASLELVDLGKSVDHGSASGRIAFAIPFDQQPEVNKRITDAGQTILTPLTVLDTPGKQSVRVIILGDPDGHEICFVDDEGFRKLSVPEENANAELQKFLNKDLAALK